LDTSSVIRVIRVIHGSRLSPCPLDIRESQIAILKSHILHYSPSLVDPRTVQFYAANAAELARRYIAAGSAPARHFAIAFTPGSRILDIGCGSGRDLQALLDAGYDATVSTPPRKCSAKPRPTIPPSPPG
jgi:SAM-dependent methyltransferase